MKHYQIYLFTQDECAPCARVKKYCSMQLTEAEQAELHFVPLKTSSGQLTALAEELHVEMTPTLVVCHEDVLCSLDETGDEFCDMQEESVERIVGGQAIIKGLKSTLDAYTYAHPE